LHHHGGDRGQIQRLRVAGRIRDAHANTLGGLRACAHYGGDHVLLSVIRPSAASCVSRLVRAAFPPFAPVMVGLAIGAVPLNPTPVLLDLRFWAHNADHTLLDWPSSTVFVTSGRRYVE